MLTVSKFVLFKAAEANCTSCGLMRCVYACMLVCVRVCVCACTHAQACACVWTVFAINQSLAWSLKLQLRRTRGVINNDKGCDQQ